MGKKSNNPPIEMRDKLNKEPSATYRKARKMADWIFRLRDSGANGDEKGKKEHVTAIVYLVDDDTGHAFSGFKGSLFDLFCFFKDMIDRGHEMEEEVFDTILRGAVRYSDYLQGHRPAEELYEYFEVMEEEIEEFHSRVDPQGQIQPRVYDD